MRRTKTAIYCDLVGMPSIQYSRYRYQHYSFYILTELLHSDVLMKREHDTIVEFIRDVHLFGDKYMWASLSILMRNDMLPLVKQLPLLKNLYKRYRKVAPDRFRLSELERS